MNRGISMLILAQAVSLCAMRCSAPGNLRAQAAADLNCNDASLQADGSHWTFHGKASGCGKENRYIFNGEKWVSPLDRAAFDFSCKKEEMTTQVLADNEVGVAGCGHKGVYVLIQGKWLMNSAGESRNEAPAGKDAKPTQ